MSIETETGRSLSNIPTDPIPRQPSFSPDEMQEDVELQRQVDQDMLAALPGLNLAREHSTVISAAVPATATRPQERIFIFPYYNSKNVDHNQTGHWKIAWVNESNGNPPVYISAVGDKPPVLGHNLYIEEKEKFKPLSLEEAVRFSGSLRDAATQFENHVNTRSTTWARRVFGKVFPALTSKRN